MKITLVRPSLSLKEKALEYKKEHFDNNEFIINGSELFDKTDDYEKWLNDVTNNTNIETVNKNWIVTDTFFAVNENDDIVGIIDFRHTLNDFLKDFGHSGYSVRPSMRNKGYATEMLRQIIIIAKNIGLKELQLSVESDNYPSIKTILKNGGIKEREFEFENNIAYVYKVKL